MNFRRASLAGLVVSSLLVPGLIAAAAPANAVSSFSGSYFNPKGRFAGVASYSNANGYWGITDYRDGYHVVAKLQRAYQGSPFYTYATKTVSDGRAPSWYNRLPSGGSGRIQVCFYDSNWNALNKCDYVYTQLGGE
jgi:hypothetical protein